MMELEYIAVAEEGGEPIEVELEEDLSVSLSTLSSEFGSGISGLSYRNSKTGLRRLLRASTDGTRVNPPRSGWSSEVTYIICRAKHEESVPMPQCSGVNPCMTPRGIDVNVEKAQLTETVKKEVTAATVISGLLLLLS